MTRLLAWLGIHVDVISREQAATEILAGRPRRRRDDVATVERIAPVIELRRPK